MADADLGAFAPAAPTGAFGDAAPQNRNYWPDPRQSAMQNGLMPPSELGPSAMAGHFADGMKRTLDPLIAAAQVDPGLSHEEYARQVGQALYGTSGSPLQWMMPGGTAVAAASGIGSVARAVAHPDPIVEAMFQARMRGRLSELGDLLTTRLRQSDPLYARGLSEPVGPNRSGAVAATIPWETMQKLYRTPYKPKEPLSVADRFDKANNYLGISAPVVTPLGEVATTVKDRLDVQNGRLRDYGMPYSESPNQ